MIASHSWAGRVIAVVAPRRNNRARILAALQAAALAPIEAAPEGSPCDTLGHTPGGVNGNGWVFCSRCGTSLWKQR